MWCIPQSSPSGLRMLLRFNSCHYSSTRGDARPERSNSLFKILAVLLCSFWLLGILSFLALHSVWLSIPLLFCFVLICVVVVISSSHAPLTHAAWFLFLQSFKSHLPWNIQKYAIDASLAMRRMQNTLLLSYWTYPILSVLPDKIARLFIYAII